jgi:hypothetical protein
MANTEFSGALDSANRDREASRRPCLSDDPRSEGAAVGASGPRDAQGVIVSAAASAGP